ncbi:Rv2175c family DNA-binding protein [Thalassiella azotivora]
MTLPDVAEHLGVDLRRVRRMLDDHVLAAVRRGHPRVLSVPRALVDPEPMPELPGTLSVLADSGYGTAEALVWLFTPDETLPGTPVENLRAGRKTEIRRRAQALAF